jgi:Fungal N-terminal domain of STAND proteins
MGSSYFSTSITMDPLSILSSSVNLVSTCSKITSYIYAFINKTKVVNTAVQLLGIEVDSLSQALGSISTSFDDPLLANAALDHHPEHWGIVKRSMDDCKGTLKNLEGILKGFNKADRGFLHLSTKQIKWEMKSEEITLHRQRIAAYRDTMQLSLQLITMYVASLLSFFIIA